MTPTNDQQGGLMDTFFERLLLQVAAIVLQLAILQIVRWVRRPAAGGIVVR